MKNPGNKLSRPAGTAGDYLRLLRIKDWVKNLAILLPLFFSLRIDEPRLLARALLAVAIFCLVSSAVYIVNDLKDAEMDRIHPQKKFRPLASGAIAKLPAISFLAALLAAGLAAAALFCPAMLPLLLLYFLLNLAYSLKLKYLPIVDVFIIASGYVIRILVGGVVTQTALSMWIIIMIFLLAMFIGLAKRRDDVIICLETGVAVRKVVEAYNLKFIDVALTIMAAVTIVSYIMYTVSPDVVAKFRTDNLYLTTAFVVAGILRYLQMIYVEKKGGFPTDLLLKDLFLQIVFWGWLITFGILIYAAR
jgi:decaprenyl-phosphate phosphoribosyltransferase